MTRHSTAPAARAERASAAADIPPLLYLDAAAVMAAMPPLEERLRLAEITMRAIGHEGELPPKIGVHPRLEASFGHAMPAHLRAPAEDAAARGQADAAVAAHELLGVKWVVGFPTNSQRSLPTIHATVILNDAVTGVPLAILDGGPITAQRTAAVSGIAIRYFGPHPSGQAERANGAPGPVRAALIGAGVQGRSHVPVLGHVLPDVSLSVYDRHPERADALAVEARSTPGVSRASVASTAREAVAGADVVVTAASFGPVRQVMTNDWLIPNALVVPIDYATYCAAEVAREAALFLVDEVGQFAANREAGLFEGYPDPAGTLGDAIRAGASRPPNGRVVVTHLGVGLADVIFANAILTTARASGLGITLPR